MRIVSALVAIVLLALSSGCASAPPVSVVSSTVQRLVDTDLDLSDIAALAALLREPKVDVVAVTLTPNGTDRGIATRSSVSATGCSTGCHAPTCPWPAGGSTPPQVPSPSRPPFTRVPRGSGD